MRYRLSTLLIMFSGASILFTLIGYLGITNSSIIAVPLLVPLAMFSPPVLGAMAGASQRSPIKAFFAAWLGCICTGAIFGTLLSVALELTVAERHDWQIRWNFMPGLAAFGGSAVFTGLVVSVPTLAYVASRQRSTAHQSR